MKLFFFSCLLAVTVNAAEKTHLNPSSTDDFLGASLVYTEYGVNSVLGRAWVEVVAAPSAEDARPKVFKHAVEGLTYDSASSKVLLKIDGKSVVCAEVTRKSFIRHTGNCEIVMKYSTKTHDDGFVTQEKKYYSISVVEVE